jgi:O-antigen/teichoic acid export membrane protein
MTAMSAIEQPSATADVTLEAPPADLRGRTARGTIINAAFMVGVSGIGLVQGIVIARLLPTDVFGLWGLLMAAFMTLLMLGSVGIDDKYIQQDDADQQKAFEIAFTLQMILGPIFVVVVLVGMPLFALVYGRPEIVGPGAALALALPALAFQMPLWAHYRRMDFLRLRLLGAIDPIVTFVATVSLALAGLGLWALVIGALTGTWVASAVMVATSPYRLRLRFERAALREYRRFSWPLLVGALTTVLMIQGPVIVGSRVLGLTAVAGIALATTISQFTNHVESLLTQSMYPAICRVKDRRELLWEAFWKSNRLALLWAAPLGVAAALFAGDFVHHVIGEKWRFAVPLIALYGLIAVVNQIGFNWTAFFRALGDTRPIAVQSTINLGLVTAIAVPLLAVAGLTAFGAGLAATSVAMVGVRLRFMRRLFPGAAFARHVARGLGPTVPAAAAVLVLRAAEPGARSLGWVAAEAVLFGLVVVAATWLLEGRLLRESVSYLRRGRGAA